jgi:hypothetical protein
MLHTLRRAVASVVRPTINALDLQLTELCSCLSISLSDKSDGGPYDWQELRTVAAAGSGLLFVRPSPPTSSLDGSKSLPETCNRHISAASVTHAARSSWPSPTTRHSGHGNGGLGAVVMATVMHRAGDLRQACADLAKAGKGRRIQSATLISDAKYSWLDALSSAGALAGLVAVTADQRWGDPVAGLAVTLFICHVGYEVTTDIGHRLLDGVDPGVITAAEEAAAAVPGVRHAHARARWTGRTLRVDIEGWVDPALPVAAADQLGHQVIEAVHEAVPAARAVTVTPRAMPDPA